MLFQRVSDQRQNPFAMKTFEGKKLSWKDKFKRDIFRQNFKEMEMIKARKRKDIKEQEQKRAAAKVLSKLFQKKSIYLQDNQQEFSRHGQYSSYIPLTQQVKLKDQLHSTFPYIEYLFEKSHTEAKFNIQNEISTFIRNSVDTNSVQVAWRSCLKKFMCDLDTLKAIQIYVQLLKKGTDCLQILHRNYGNQCSPLVFFHRVCQSARYFKESSSINKNIQSSIEVGDQINQVSLPKTSKYLFCSICLLYDCNQHNIDDTVSNFNFQYIARQNIIQQKKHVNMILKLISFQKRLSSPKQSQRLHNSQQIELEEGEQYIEDNHCSSGCYLFLTKQTFTKKAATRRPIISLIHRSLIHMVIDIFSYDPCLISMWIGRETIKTGKQSMVQQANRGISCQNVFFYLIQEYDLSRRIHNQLYKSEEDYLMNQSSRPKNQEIPNNNVPNKKKKNTPRFDHNNNENYRIGCCFHYFIGQDVIDHSCQKCRCKDRGFCLPQCQCPKNCPIKKTGCSCKGRQDCKNNKKCKCIQGGQQCTPGICENCFDTKGLKNKKNFCRNAMVLKQQTKYVRIGDSNICGLGAFAGEDINKDDLVIIYTGEMIEHQIDFMREGLRLDETFYNFSLNEGGAVDARFMGNKSRFINHQQGTEQNLLAHSMFSEGKFKTVLYAKKNIKKGEELYFNYDEGGTIAINFPGKYPFIKPPKK